MARASTAAKALSSSTDADARDDSLQRLIEARERLRQAEAKQSRAQGRRDSAEDDVKRLKQELRGLGFDPDGKASFDAWLQVQADAIEAGMAEIESGLDGDG